MLARLERIEALEREGAGVPSLLAELRELVREATAWAECERDPRARRAAEELARAHLQRAHEPLVASAAAVGPIE